MFARHQHTIVFVTRDVVARVDLCTSGSIDVINSAIIDRDASIHLVDGIEQALALSARKPGKTWILADDFWSGTVDLAADVTAQITPAQIEQAITLEAEFDSGISAFESRIGFVPAAASDPQQSSWWTVQIESLTVDAIDACVKNSAGHVGGLASTESIPAQSITAPPITAENIEQRAIQWLKRCLAAPPEVPVVRFSTPSFATKYQRMLGTIAACAVVLASGAIHVDGKRKLDQVATAASQLDLQKTYTLKQISERESEGRQLRELQKQQEAADAAKIKQAQQQRESQYQYQSLRKRPAELFNALTVTAHQDHWIQSFEFEKERVVITGLALGHAAISRLAAELERQLPSDRWSVQPATMQLEQDVDLVRFTITVVAKQTMPLITDQVAELGGTSDVR